MKKIFVPVISLSMCLLCGVVLASSAIFALRSSSATFSVSLTYTQTIKSKIEFALNDNSKTNLKIIYANVGLDSNGNYDANKSFPIPASNIVSDTSQDYNETDKSYSYNITLNSNSDGLYHNAKCSDTFIFRITNYTENSQITAKIIPEASTAGALRNSIVICDNTEVSTDGVTIAAKTTSNTYFKDFEISILVFEETNISFRIELSKEIDDPPQTQTD